MAELRWTTRWTAFIFMIATAGTLAATSSLLDHCAQDPNSGSGIGWGLKLTQSTLTHADSKAIYTFPPASPPPLFPLPNPPYIPSNRPFRPLLVVGFLLVLLVRFILLLLLFSSSTSSCFSHAPLLHILLRSASSVFLGCISFSLPHARFRPTSARRAAVVSLRRADRRPWVISSLEADFCNQSLILQHPKSTRLTRFCTPPHSTY